MTTSTTPIALVDVYFCLVALLTLFPIRCLEEANGTSVRLRLLRIRVSPGHQYSVLLSRCCHQLGRQCDGRLQCRMLH